MNIAFITHYSALYGANRSLINLISGLKNLGHQAIVIAPEQGTLTDYLKNKGIDIHIVPFQPFFTNCPSNEKIIIQRVTNNVNCTSSITDICLKNKVELIYSNSSVIDIGLIVSKIIQKPHIWHFREFGDIDYQIVPDCGKRVFKRLVNLTDGLIFISEALQNHYHGVSQNSTIVYNGVVACNELVRCNISWLNKRLQPILNFIIIGLVSPMKGQDQAVYAFKKVIQKYPNAVLEIVGGGQIEWIKKIVIDNNLESSVRILGEVQNPLEYFLKSDVALMCSLNEAMGRVTLEAMACGIPVIGNNSAATSELISNCFNGLLYDGSVNDLVGKMIYLIENPFKAREMGLNGINDVRENYTIEKYSGQINNYIKKVVAGFEKRDVKVNYIGYRGLSVFEKNVARIYNKLLQFTATKLQGDNQHSNLGLFNKSLTKSSQISTPNSTFEQVEIETAILNFVNDLISDKKEKQEIKVSAIVSTYNSEKFIRGCLEDLISQTLYKKSALEIVIVNSGSTENEDAIIREYNEKCKNIVYIKTDNREGIYKAWNRGIRAASGKYITNANTDDRHRKDALEVMSSILETLPEISLVYADAIITETKNESFEHCSPVGFYRWMNFNRDDLLNKGCYVGPQPMWRRQVHDEYGYFDESFVTSGDYEFWLRISQAGTFLHIPVLLGLYLKSPDSIEHTNRNRQVEENRRIFEMYADAKSSGKIIGRLNHPAKPPAAGPTGAKAAVTTYEGVQELIRNGEYVTAVEKLVALTAEFPLFASAYNDLGILYHNRGELEKALSFYRKAVKLEPQNVTFLKNLADFYCVALGKIEAAMEIYVHILQQDPFDVESLLAMGYICRRLERFEDAESFYARVLEIDAGNETARKYMGFDEPSRAASDAPFSAETAYEQLIEDMQHDSVDAGIAKISSLLAAFPELARAHSDLGALYQRSGDPEHAGKHFENAAALEQDNPQFQKNLADFYLVAGGQKERALEIYSRLLEKDPDNEQLLLLSGHICVALKQLEGAADFYRRLLAKNPDNADARTNLEAIERAEETHSEKAQSLPETPQPATMQEPTYGTTAESGPTPKADRLQVSILVSASGPVSRLRRCVEAIEQQTPQPHELLFLDSGTTKGTAKWLQKLLSENTHCRKIRCKGNENMATAFNAGIAAATGRFIVRLANDVLVTPGWLPAMLAHLEHSTDAGIVSAMSNVAAERQKTPSPWDEAEGTLEVFASVYQQRNCHRRIPVKSIGGFCMLFRRELVEKIGPFDEQMGQGHYEAQDLCLRAALAGFQNLIAGDVYLHRLVGKAPICNKKAFNLKWSGADAKSTEGKKYLALLTVHKAHKALQAERIEEAGELFLQAIGLHPECRKNYRQLAEMLIQTRQFEDALQVLGQIPEGPPDVGTLVLAATCEEGLDHDEKAQTLGDQALHIDPNNASVFNLQGILTYRKGDLQIAAKWFQRAITADPGFAEAYTNLGALKWEAGEKTAALDLYERAFILEPGVSDIATNYHKAMAELSQYACGVPVLHEAAAIYPFSKKIRYMLIDCLIHLQQYGSALEVIEAAVADFGVEDGILASALKIREMLGPLKIEDHDPDHPSVSLCMIVKNEEAYLAKCLRSVKPVVDEIIVVDTGSNDRSEDIARVYGSKIITFDWTEDFSAARNFALSKASGNVIFVMDADEALSPIDYDRFRLLARQSDHTGCAYIVNTRNYTLNNNLVEWVANEGQYGHIEVGTGWTPSAKIRIFPNDPRVHFEFPVHEMVEPSLKKAGIGMKPCDLQIHHYGTLNRKKSNQKGETYYKIGRKKLAETKDSPVALREFAVQAEILKKHDEAIEFWKRFIILVPNEPKAYINMGISYCSLGQFDNVLTTAKKVLQLNPDSKEGHYNFALAKLHLSHPEQALATLEELCQKMPEYLPARFLLATAHCVTGNKGAGMAMLDKLSRTSIGPGLAIRCHELAKDFITSGNPTYAMALLDAAIDGKHSNKDALDLYADCLKQSHSNPKTGAYE